jgi:hypothetical protein
VNPDVPAVPAHPTTAMAPDVLMAIIAADAKAPANTFRHLTKFSILDMRTPSRSEHTQAPGTLLLTVYENLRELGDAFNGNLISLWLRCNACGRVRPDHRTSVTDMPGWNLEALSTAPADAPKNEHQPILFHR